MLSAGGTGRDGGSEERSLEPGSPVGVELVRGDMRIAATGTVTWVEGDRVYAFGHPFLGSGRVEMPMVSAEVIHTLADLAGSFKLSNIGGELGAVVEDRHAAIVGQIGRRARMIPVDLSVHGADYGDADYSFEVIRSPSLAPVLSAVSVMTALQTSAGYSQTATLMARGRVRMRDLPDLPLEMAVAGTAGSDPSGLLALTALGTGEFLEFGNRAELRPDPGREQAVREFPDGAHGDLLALLGFRLLGLELRHEAEHLILQHLGPFLLE